VTNWQPIWRSCCPSSTDRIPCPHGSKNKLAHQYRRQGSEASLGHLFEYDYRLRTPPSPDGGETTMNLAQVLSSRARSIRISCIVFEGRKYSFAEIDERSGDGRRGSSSRLEQGRPRCPSASKEHGIRFSPSGGSILEPFPCLSSDYSPERSPTISLIL